MAVIRLVRSSVAPEEAEVPVTIIDEYQRRGFGSLLLGLLILAAAERGFARLSLTFLPTNEGIRRPVEKFGPARAGARSRDAVQLFLELGDLDLAGIRARLALYLPEIGDFRLET